MSAPRVARGLAPERAEALLEKMRGRRVLVAGDLMLDRYVGGRVERISPEAPVPVVRMDEESESLGGAGNVAANVASLGGRCRLVGVVGEDPAGASLRKVAEAAGVDPQEIRSDPTRPTTVKTRISARRQQIARVDRECDGDLSPGLARILAERIPDLVSSCEVLVLEDYNKGALVETVIEAALEAGRANGIPVVVDPKRIRFFSYRGATLFKPNARELADALGTRLRPDSSRWLEKVRRRLGCECLLLTLGEAGMALAPEGGEPIRIPTAARDVYDVSGAGDTVTATVALALAAGASATEAALLASHAAAVEVGKAGVACVVPTEILGWIRGTRGEREAGP